MSDHPSPLPPVPPVSPVEAEPTSTRALNPTRRAQTIEVCVFLFLIVPSLVVQLFAGTTPRLSNRDFSIVALSIIFRDLAWTFLVLYLVWRNGDGFARIGWHWRGWRRNVLAGVFAYPALLFAGGLVAAAALQIGLPLPKTSPVRAVLPYVGGWELPLLVVMVLVVAVSEETVFRGYLLLRLTTVTRSRTTAVILSTAVFAMGHAYEGPIGMAVVSFLGLAFALLYLSTGSLLSPVTAHFLWDFLAILLAPIVEQKLKGHG